MSVTPPVGIWSELDVVGADDGGGAVLAGARGRSARGQLSADRAAPRAATPQGHTAHLAGQHPAQVSGNRGLRAETRRGDTGWGHGVGTRVRDRYTCHILKLAL